MALTDPDDPLDDAHAPEDTQLADGSETDDGVLSPGSTATGAGTTEALASDRREPGRSRSE